MSASNLFRKNILHSLDIEKCVSFLKDISSSFYYQSDLISVLIINYGWNPAHLPTCKSRKIVGGVCTRSCWIVTRLKPNIKSFVCLFFPLARVNERLPLDLRQCVSSWANVIFSYFWVNLFYTHAGRERERLHLYVCVCVQCTNYALCTSDKMLVLFFQRKHFPVLESFLWRLNATSIHLIMTELIDKMAHALRELPAQGTSTSTLALEFLLQPRKC